MFETRQGQFGSVFVIVALLCSLRGGTAWGDYKYTRISGSERGFGYAVSMDGDYAIIGAPGTKSAHIFTRAEGIWVGPTKLSESDGLDVPSGFGASVAISADLAVVGSVGWADEGDTGEVCVFRRAADDWELEKVLSHRDAEVIHDPIPGGQFGACISTDGETIVVGAPGFEDSTGRVYVFQSRCVPDFNDIVRGQVSRYIWLSSVLVASDGAPDVRFGASVSVKGDTIIVGAPGHSDNGAGSGAVYILQRDDAGAWQEGQKFLGEPNSAFGSSVCTDGSTLAIGAPGMEPVGQVHVYYAWLRWVGGPGGPVERSWYFEQTLEPWDVSGRELSFGSSVSLDGDLLVVGAPMSPLDPSIVNPPSGNGEVYLFAREPSSWVPPHADFKPCTILYAEQATHARSFGRSVSVSGNGVLVGQNVIGGQFGQNEAIFYYDFACDATESIAVSPSPSYDFGSVPQGESSVTTFTIRSTGNLDVTVDSVASSSPHFVVKDAPIGQTVPPDATFDVEFLAGSISGTHSATITVSGTGASGSVEVATAVSGTTVSE